MEKENIMSMLDCKLNDNLTFATTSNSIGTASSNTINSGDYTASNNYYTGWGYWQDYYYPQVIRESYPVYVRDRAEDKGKQAFEIIKMMQDNKFLNLEKVKDFINLMDALIKIL